jgi:hypothetical protein
MTFQLKPLSRDLNNRLLSETACLSLRNTMLSFKHTVVCSHLFCKVVLCKSASVISNCSIIKRTVLLYVSTHTQTCILHTHNLKQNMENRQKMHSYIYIYIYIYNAHTYLREAESFFRSWQSLSSLWNPFPPFIWNSKFYYRLYKDPATGPYPNPKSSPHPHKIFT